jgi:hypothetical protein
LALLGALLVPVQAEAARCRLGLLWRTTMGVCVTPQAMASAGIRAVRRLPRPIRLARRVQAVHLALPRRVTIPVNSRRKTAEHVRSREQLTWGPPFPAIAGPSSLHPLPAWYKQPW